MGLERCESEQTLTRFSLFGELDEYVAYEKGLKHSLKEHCLKLLIWDPQEFI